jgi:long-chain acyl-CoA synthetase
MATDSQAIAATVKATVTALTSPGAPFEMATERVGGAEYRVYRHAFATLPGLLAAARVHGDKPFIVADGQVWTFAQVFAQADALAGRMQVDLGVEAGDRVAIAMRNRPEWVVAFVAAVLAGAIPAPLNSFGLADELGAALADVRPRVTVLDEERLARLSGTPALDATCAIVVGTGRDALDFHALAAPGGPAPRPVLPRPDDHALILYTSGASSRAKGVLSTHRAVCQALFNIDFIGAFSAATSPQALQRLMARGLLPTTLTAVPLFHVSGLHAQLLTALRHGRRLVFVRRWNPAEAIALIREHRVTQFNGAPAMVMQLIAEPGFDEAAATLGGVGFGGAGLPRRLIDEVLTRLPGSMSGIGFGMTESNGVGAAVSGSLFEAQPDAAGVVSPLIDVRVVDLDGSEMPTGQPGEIWLRGVSLMQGYWEQPEATAKTLEGGWLHTGDIGFVDAGGLLHVIDRIKDVINRSGEKIAAAEVESCLLQHPDVLEAAVFGRPDQSTGEAVLAQVALRPGSPLQVEALRAFVASRIAAYKVPAEVRLQLEPLPRNPAGKLLKSALRAAWLAEPDAPEPGANR